MRLTRNWQPGTGNLSHWHIDNYSPLDLSFRYSHQTGNWQPATGNLLLVLHILLNLVHEHCIDGFFDGWEDVQYAIELRDSDQF